MIHRLLAVAILVVLFAAPAFAIDIDRHGNYTEGPAGAAVAKCKNFTGTDDNRGACSDWCSSYTTANAGASCACDEGACPEASQAAPVAAAAPATAH
jgi:hypothetical protein